MRTTPDDFVVEEVPLYTPSGEGEHLYLFLEKRGLSTTKLVRVVCEALGAREREVGYAGRKDEQGITRQWLSLPRKGAEDRLAALDDVEGVQLLDARPHGNKLRLGHLSGNRFTVSLRGALDVERLAARADALSVGFPNAFGAQRFGPGDESLRQAERWVGRRRPARSRKDKFLVSVVQSALFNGWLAARLRQDAWLQPLDGDWLQKGDGRGPTFICDDPAVDGARALSGEVTLLGPLWGSKLRRALREGLTFESRSLHAEGANEARLLAHPAFRIGGRRPVRAYARELSIEPETAGARVSFTLPPGSYATVFLGELVGPGLRDRAFAGADERDAS
jgi:tRNA pseudouridine13 synthase